MRLTYLIFHSWRDQVRSAAAGLRSKPCEDLSGKLRQCEAAKRQFGTVHHYLRCRAGGTKSLESPDYLQAVDDYWVVEHFIEESRKPLG